MTASPIDPLGARPAPPAGDVRTALPLWRVPPGQALHLQAAPHPRWLRLHDGQLWLTADARRGAPPPDDWWLSPGQTLRLPAGTAVLAEGWPSASFELLEEPRG